MHTLLAIFGDFNYNGGFPPGAPEPSTRRSKPGKAQPTDKQTKQLRDSETPAPLSNRQLQSLPGRERGPRSDIGEEWLDRTLLIWVSEANSQMCYLLTDWFGSASHTQQLFPRPSRRAPEAGEDAGRRGWMGFRSTVPPAYGLGKGGMGSPKLPFKQLLFSRCCSREDFF